VFACSVCVHAVRVLVMCVCWRCVCVCGGSAWVCLCMQRMYA